MNRTEIENQLLNEIRSLPIEKFEEILEFTIKQRENAKTTHLTQRPIALLDGKEKCHISEDFKMTDEEFLHDN